MEKSSLSTTMASQASRASHVFVQVVEKQNNEKQRGRHSKLSSAAHGTAGLWDW
jgi:hypothetical protein